MSKAFCEGAHYRTKLENKTLANVTIGGPIMSGSSASYWCKFHELRYQQLPLRISGRREIIGSAMAENVGLVFL